MMKIDEREIREKAKKNPDAFIKEYINLLLDSESDKAEIKLLQEQIKILNERLYGKKSEKKIDENIKQPTLFNIDSFYDNQDHFNEAEANQNDEESAPLNDDGEAIIKTKNNKKRKNLVNRINNLHTETVIFDIKNEEKVCPNCGLELKEMTTKVTYTIKYIPAKIERVKNIVKVYYCPKCNNEGNSYIKQARIPSCFTKSMVDSSIVANIISDKFIRCLPLYRQEKLYNNYGLDVSRANLSNWFIKGANVLEPMYNLMLKDIKNEDIIHMDETTLTVIESPKKAYMWGLASSKYGKNNIKLYIYKPDRKYDNAKEILDGYHGYVQSDGYEAYQRLDDVTNVGCFAHARRKYTDIVKSLPPESLSVSTISKGLDYINKLYKIEKDIDDLSPAEKYKIRQEKSKSLLEEYYEWCNKTYESITPKSVAGKAIAYSINNYEYLKNYLLDGRLSIDNNICERMMKSFVLSRKNFLFCFSENGADKSSIAYSIVETARANNLRTEDYLNYVFTKLGEVENPTEEDYKNLLPYSKSLPDCLKNNNE